MEMNKLLSSRKNDDYLMIIQKMSFVAVFLREYKMSKEEED